MSSEGQPGLGSVFSGAGNLISKVTKKLSGKTQKIAENATTPMKSLAVSIVVVLVLLIALGMGRGVAESYCKTESNHIKRLGRSMTSIEDTVFMVVGFLILVPLFFMQGRHFLKNMSGSSTLTKASWASWMSITLTMLVVWIVSTANYWSAEDKEEGRGKAIGTVFHVAVVITIGLLAISGSVTAAVALKK
tara:strand:- start:54 stop:626 length:573 start_codon:yes stop_codon:yes gene_type:complete